MDNETAPTWRVTIWPQGWQYDVAQDVTILAAAEAAGLMLPSSCRNGTCRTCLCRMPEGQVAYKVEWPGLSLEEKREGYTLPCVALARADVTLVAPAARRL